MKEELFNNETKRKAGQQGREESQHPVYQRQPRQLGLYDAENEHDACGVGMLVNIHGGKSHELVESALKVLENMRHRGAEGAVTKPETVPASCCKSRTSLFFCRVFLSPRKGNTVQVFSFCRKMRKIKVLS